jgi:AsmA-like C-terminal region
LKPGSHHIALTAADAFGAHWTGSFDRRDAATGWQFALTADHLSSSDLDRWLNPRWRESFLDRVLPFLNSSSPTNAVPENLRAQGQITVDQFTTAPLVLRHLQGDLKIGGRHLQLTAAKAQFYGGNLDGALDAELTAIPSYRIHFDYSRVDLASLTAPFPTLDNVFGGDATGALTLNFHGADRADLVSSLECRGNARVTDPQIKALNLGESLRQGDLTPGASSFAGGAAEFACHDGKIAVQNLAFVNPGEQITGSGSVDFSRNLDLRLRMSSAPEEDAAAAKSPRSEANKTYEFTGPLQSPALTAVRQPPNRP